MHTTGAAVAMLPCKRVPAWSWPHLQQHVHLGQQQPCVCSHHGQKGHATPHSHQRRRFAGLASSLLALLLLARACSTSALAAHQHFFCCSQAAKMLSMLLQASQ